MDTNHSFYSACSCQLSPTWDQHVFTQVDLQIDLFLVLFLMDLEELLRKVKLRCCVCFQNRGLQPYFAMFIYLSHACSLVLYAQKSSSTSVFGVQRFAMFNVDHLHKVKPHPFLLIGVMMTNQTVSRTFRKEESLWWNSIIHKNKYVEQNSWGFLRMFVLVTFQHAHLLLLSLSLHTRRTDKYSGACGFVSGSRVWYLPYLLSKESCEKRWDWQHHSG